jgi:hypothetical protein
MDGDIEQVKQALIRDGLKVGRSMHVDAFERIEEELEGLREENKRLREELERLREEHA